MKSRDPVRVIQRSSVVTRARPKTRAEELREKIEESIITGAYPPGTRLDEPRLAEHFGVSRTPIREALIQLASTGILETRWRRGAIVPQVSLQRLVEMFEVMAEVESMCGRLAARRMSEAERGPLLRAHEACQAARDQDDPDSYDEQNEIFHQVIYAASHNAFLVEWASALHRRLRSYRRLQLRVRGRMTTSFAEHQEVVDAILAGDAARAAESLRQHVIMQGERFADLVALLQQRPDTTTPDSAPLFSEQLIS